MTNPIGIAGAKNEDGTQVVIRILGQEYLRTVGHQPIGIAMNNVDPGQTVHILRRTVPRGLIELFPALVSIRSGQTVYADEVEWD